MKINQNGVGVGLLKNYMALVAFRKIDTFLLHLRWQILS